MVTLTWPARAWRLAATVAVLLGLAYGTIWGSDQHFPFGPLVQFAFSVDPDGQIRSVFIEADTTAGTRVRVPLTSEGVGIPRAEIEGQLPQIERDPSLLQGIAVAQRRRHPDQPQYRTLYLMVEITQLQDRRPAGQSVDQLAVWEVR
ncbi:MAG: hypothetical protein L0Y54_02275 [Sporichthyaceae bacterium]|nr:hypothetical protein [Sporichthyaceae bacterium]